MTAWLRGSIGGVEAITAGSIPCATPTPSNDRMVPFRQGDAEMDTVRIGIYSQVDSLRFAPIHVAAQRGYFKDVDIEPEYFYAHGPGMQKALASSETDVGPTTVERMLKAYGQ